MLFLLRRGRLRWAMLGYGILGLIGGVKMFVPTWNSSEMQSISAGALLRGEVPKSNWVNIEGRLIWEWAAVDPDPISGGYYVPIVPSNARSGPVPVVAFVGSMKGGDLQEYEKVEGLIQWGELPPLAMLQFQRAGVPLKENVIYLEYARDPITARRFSLLLIMTSLAGLGGFVHLTRTIKQKRHIDGYQLRRQVKQVGEIAQYDAEGQRITSPQEAERDDAVQQWMREHGLANSEPEDGESADEQSPAEPAAASV